MCKGVVFAKRTNTGNLENAEDGTSVKILVTITYTRFPIPINKFN